MLLPFALIAIRWSFCLIWEFFPKKDQLSTTFDFRAYLQDRRTIIDINWLSGGAFLLMAYSDPAKHWSYLWFWTQSYIHFPAPSCLTVTLGKLVTSLNLISSFVNNDLNGWCEDWMRQHMYSARHIIGRARFETQCMTPKLKLLILHLLSKGF